MFQSWRNISWPAECHYCQKAVEKQLVRHFAANGVDAFECKLEVLHGVRKIYIQTRAKKVCISFGQAFTGEIVGKYFFEKMFYCAYPAFMVLSRFWGLPAWKESLYQAYQDTISYRDRRFLLCLSNLFRPFVLSGIVKMMLTLRHRYIFLTAKWQSIGKKLTVPAFTWEKAPWELWRLNVIGLN